MYVQTCLPMGRHRLQTTKCSANVRTDLFCNAGSTCSWLPIFSVFANLIFVVAIHIFQPRYQSNMQVNIAQTQRCAAMYRPVLCPQMGLESQTYSFQKKLPKMNQSDRNPFLNFSYFQKCKSNMLAKRKKSSQKSIYKF